MKKKVLFIHGFGVRKDSRGMFTQIANRLENIGRECILFDLNTILDDESIRVSPYSEQVRIIKDIFKKIEGSEWVDIICHSQGCMVGSLTSLPNIRKTIFLAPPINDDNRKSIEYFSQNPSTVINLEGESKIARSDGTFTVVPKAFFEEREGLDLKKLYQGYIKDNDCLVIKANQDEVISNDGIEEVMLGAKIIAIDANHNFDGEARDVMIDLIEKELL